MSPARFPNGMALTGGLTGGPGGRSWRFPPLLPAGGTGKDLGWPSSSMESTRIDWLWTTPRGLLWGIRQARDQLTLGAYVAQCRTRLNVVSLTAYVLEKFLDVDFGS